VRDDQIQGRIELLVQISILTAGQPRKFSRNGVLQKGSASLLEIRVCLGEEGRIQAQIKAALAKKPNATVYSYSGQRHAFYPAARTATRRRWLTGGQANF
jgi:hypothetical protein